MTLRFPESAPQAASRGVALSTLGRVALFLLSVSLSACTDGIGATEDGTGGLVDGATPSIDVDVSDVADGADVTNGADVTDGADGADGVDPGPTVCETDFRYFARDVWAQTLKTNCSGCHNPDGLASGSGMVFLAVNDVSDLEANHETFKAFASIAAADGQLPYVLAKPTGSFGHGGGQVFAVGDESFRRIETYIARLETPTDTCPPEPGFLDGVTLESAYRTLRRFTLNFAGRLPSTTEIASVDGDGDTALAEALDQIMDEDAFARRIAEGFNDVLLTEGSPFEIAMLGTVNHPNLLWFIDLEPEAKSKGLSDSVYGVKQGVNELIRNIVAKDEPFSNILLADYSMVNPASARALGVFDMLTWVDPEDRDEFQPTKLHFTKDETPYPHAGVLNNYIYLNKYQSTPTNVNRARARAFLLHFLGTDILEFSPVLADPLAIIAQYENPIRDANNCAICHIAVDSIAGLFHNHYSRGARYAGPVPENSFPAGFRITSPDGTLPIGERTWTGGLLPAQRDFDSLRWLAEQAVADPRFAPTMVKHVFSIVLGRPLLNEPVGAPSAKRSGHFRAYEEQQEAIRTWAKDFIASDYNLKLLVKAIALSPFYRARFQTVSTPESEHMWHDLGRAQLLKPLELDRKLRAIFGATFQTFPLWEDGLLKKYRILYGGIDSNTIEQRLYEPNGLMGGVQQLIANNVSCRQSSREFDQPVGDRLLLSGVELDTTDEAAIRATLVHLHERLAGERVEPTSEAINISYKLFTEVRDEGAQEVAAKNISAKLGRPCEAGDITEDPTFVVRAWAAVINYLMQSFDFLYN